MISSSSPSLHAFFAELRTGGSFLIEELWDAPKAYLAASIVQATGRSMLLITGGTREDRLFSDLTHFAPKCILEYPSWETLPGENIPPSPDILGKRFETLYTLLQRTTPSILLCPLTALLQKGLPKEALAPLLSRWKKGMQIPFHTLSEKLQSLGYQMVSVVSDKGQFSCRGGIVDLFPTASTDPYRIEFLDDSVEQIRAFDPVGQRTTGTVESFLLSPAKELPLLQQAERLCPITDYLGKDPIFFWDDLLLIENAYVNFKQMLGSQSPLFFPLEELFSHPRQQIFCASHKIEELSQTVVSINRTHWFASTSFEVFQHSFEAMRFFHPFRSVQPLAETLSRAHQQILCLSATEGEELEFKKKLSDFPVFSRENLQFDRGNLSAGYEICDAAFSLIPSVEATHKSYLRRQKWRSAVHTPAAEFHELFPGDFVVHFHSGIGRYAGVEKGVNHLGQETEFLCLEYAQGSKLLVPLSQAHLVSRYIGTKEDPPSLSQLGSKRWYTSRIKAQTQIVGFAHDLLQIYAQRAKRHGPACVADSETMRQFEQAFPYVETEDQILAIQAIKKDMMSDRPMDRLICGDVGYGKTEVAMRAAFKAVVDGGKQVAVLVPTTVLSLQHWETFSQRVADFPLRVELLSRFRSLKESASILEKTAKGEVDILIGTHRLLSADVHWKDLGLIVIDEEQRFGVRAKEHLKKAKIGVDCLALSATPIPRTLYMSLVQARDMSVIHTPPQDRLPIQTILAEKDPVLIQNALQRELARGGQAFYIHNRIETIYSHAAMIQTQIPSARIAVVHGQMEPEAIDTIFHHFKQGAVDILCATTIIENGIDIPNANTILIDRADTYGLADLYQLRGRVGRWNRSAYAYFLIAKNVRLTEVAHRRLQALAESSGYGGGMRIALRDLEIRGAGDILGVQQAGQVSTIGFHLYCKLLKRAIDALQKRQPVSFHEIKMEFPYPAYLPEDYVNAFSLRMELYHRFGEASSFAEVDELLAELKDRFGTPPLPVLWLYHLNRIRIFAMAQRFSSLQFGERSLLVEQQHAKQSERKTVLLPKQVQTPAALEGYVLQALSQM